MKKTIYLLIAITLVGTFLWFSTNGPSAPSLPGPWLEKARAAKFPDEKIYYLNHGIGAVHVPDDAYLLRGRAYQAKAHPDFDPLGTERLRYRKLALEDFEQVLKNDPDNALALAYRAGLEMESSLQKATADLDRALELAPENVEILQLKIRQLILSRDLPSGLEIVDRLLSHDPQDIQGRILKASILRRQGNFDLALEEYAQALSQEPNNIKVFFARANSFRVEKREREALEDLDRVLSIEPANMRALRSRSEVERAQGKTRQAAADRARADELDPEHWLGLGVFAAPETSDKALSRAIELNPWNPLYFLIRGRARADLSQMEKARSDFAKVLELDARIAMAYVYDGQVLAKMGRKDEALARYKQACDLGKCEPYEQAYMEQQRPLDEEFWRKVFAQQVPAREINQRYRQNSLARWEAGIVRDQLAKINYEAYNHGTTRPIKASVQEVLLRLFDEESGVPGLLAAYPDVSEKILASLAKSDNDQTLAGVARNLRTPRPILLALTERKSMAVAKNLAGNANLPDEAVLRLVKHDSVEIAREVRLNPRIQQARAGEPTAELVTEIYALRSPFGDEWRYRNDGEGHNLSKEVTIEQKTLLLLSQDPKELVRSWVARSRITSAEVLDLMAGDTSEQILSWVFLNNSSSPQIRRKIAERLIGPAGADSVDALLTRLAHSNDPGVRAAVAANHEVPSDIATFLATDREENVLVALVRNPQVSAKTLASLANCRSGKVQTALAGNRGVPPETLRRLATGSSSLRQLLAANPHTPPDVLEAFAQDSVPYVRGISANTRRTLAKIPAYLEEQKRLPELLRLPEDPNSDDALQAAKRIRLVEEICKLLDRDTPYFYHLWAKDPSFRYEAGNPAWEAAAEEWLQRWYRAFYNLEQLILRREIDLATSCRLLPKVFHALYRLPGQRGDCRARIGAEEKKRDFLLNVWPKALALEANPPPDRVSTYQKDWLNLLLEYSLQSQDGDFSQDDLAFLRTAIDLSIAVPFPAYQMTHFLERRPPGRIPLRDYVAFLRELSHSNQGTLQLYGRYGLLRMKEDQPNTAGYLAETGALLDLCRHFGNDNPPPRSELESMVKRKKLDLVNGKAHF